MRPQPKEVFEFEPPVQLRVPGGRALQRAARNAGLALTDVAMISLSVAIGFVTWAGPMRNQSPQLYLDLAPLLVLFPMGYARMGLYPSLGLGPVEIIRRLSFVTTSGFLLVAAFSFAFKLPHLYSRATFVLAFLISLLLVPLARATLFHVGRRWSWWAEPVVIIGTGRRAARAIRDIKGARHLGYRPVAVLASDGSAHGGDLEGVPIVGGVLQSPQVAAQGIRVAFLETERLQTRRTLDRLQQHFQHVILLHEFDDLPVEGLVVRNLGNFVGIEYTNNLLLPMNAAAKRLMDILFGGVALVLAAPVILLSALAVLVVDGRPAFFQQDRAGKDGRRINVPKIRTMRRDADRRLADHLSANSEMRDEWRIRYKLRDDPRLIPGLGRLFRRYSIDELPQLWSVVTGRMSLVGPRPFPDYHLRDFGPVFLELRQRVRPGITGLWQVSVRSEGGIEEQEAHDAYYIRNWSIWFDIYILCRTIVAVAGGRGAY